MNPLRTLALLAAAALLTGCATSTAMKSDPVAEYHVTLETLNVAPAAAPGSPAARAGVERFKAFFANMTADSVRELTQKTYAPNAVLNDTLKTVRGSAAIEEYFLETVKNAKLVRATIEDVAVSENDTYVRWTMEIEFAQFRKGEITRTIGITQLRFDPEGRVTLHQDFWDSTAGFFEHLPVLGSAIRWIKSNI